jgi:BirA family biotin operon repressor/biotin-[acetyl-CoA-carboxylase] ligase
MKDIVLNLLKSADGYLSGAAVSKQLGVTRAAIWKVIKSLQQEGYLIEAVPNRGYRLAGPADILNEFEIKASLQDVALASFITQVHFSESAGSTNQLAHQAVETGAPSGSLFVAACQTSGRGRRGRTWQSDHRQGLWFSLLLRPQVPSAVLSTITLFTGLCIVRALRQGFGIGACIKWPNDVVSSTNGRKLCGILTESIVEEQTVIAAIIGIGLNINTRAFPPDLSESATSLYLESTREFRRTDVLAAILREFFSLYESFKKDKSWLSEYARHCLTLGQEVLVLPENGESFTGRATGLDETGELIVEDDVGLRRTVLSGEVSILGQKDTSE